jgi:hypothetical protein
MRWKWSCPILRYYYNTGLNEQEEPQKSSVSMHLGSNSKLTPPEHEVGVLTTMRQSGSKEKWSNKWQSLVYGTYNKHVPLKCQYLTTKLHGTTSQNAIITTALGTSNPIHKCSIDLEFWCNWDILKSSIILQLCYWTIQVVFKLFCLCTPIYNFYSFLYPQSCWCIIQVIRSL